MKQAIFLATLMYSSATVFGMQGEKRGLADQSSDSSSKVRLIEVSAPKYQQPLDKQLDSQTLEEMLGRANQDLEQARKDIDDFGWLYKDASKRVKSADKRAEIITKIFGDNQNLQGILEDKQKAEKELDAFFALYRDAQDRKGSAKERVDMLTQQLTKLRVSEDSSQKSKEGMDIDKNAQKGSSSSETIKELKQTTQTAANNSPATNGKNPVVRLCEYCQGKNLSLKFGYKKNKDKTFNRKIKLENKIKSKDEIFDLNLHCKSKKEAKKKIAEHVYNQLVAKAKNGEASSSGTNHTQNKEILKNEYEQLIEAVKNKDIETLESLIGQGVDIDETVFGKFSTPLENAVKGGYTDVITFLLNNGADPNEAPEVLKFAVNTGNKDLIKLALAKGADPNKAPKVLEFAVNSGDKDLVELALLKGADPNVLDKEDNSMLMLALKKEYIEIARLFLSNSCSDHILDFIYAGKNKQPMSNDSIKLKERSIFRRYDTPNKKGESPLIQAIRTLEYSDLLGILTSLLKNKLVLNRIDSSTGYSVLTLAKLKKRGEEIIKLLEDAGARDVYMDDYMPPAGNEKSPIARLYEYCQNRNKDLKFEYKPNKEKFNCIIVIKDEKGNVKNTYNDGKYHESKREAKNATAAYALCEIMKKKGWPVPDFRDPIEKLDEYCRDKSNNLSWSDLKFDYEINTNGEYSCAISIKDEKGNVKNTYDNGKSYKSKREAKNKTADYTLRKLMGLDRDPIKELNDYCLDKSTSVNPSDIAYIRDINEDNTFNCKIKLKDEIFDLNLRCKTEMEAERIIAEYVYNLLVAKAKNGEASSSGTN